MKFSNSFAIVLPLLSTLLAPGALLLPVASLASESGRLEVVWSSPSGTQPLRSWSNAELTAMKSVSTQEKDMITGKRLKWKGILFSRLVDEALSKLTVEQKAQVDLLVLTNDSGGQAFIPRHVINRYPLLAAYQKDGKPVDGNLAVVVPISSAPRIQGEGLPLGTYALAGVTQLELTSYTVRYASLFLKRRTDPAAIRGEKMFVRNCIACHPAGQLSSGTGTRSLASTGHPAVSVPRLSERDIRALFSYLDAYRTENPQTVVPTAAPAKTTAGRF